MTNNTELHMALEAIDAYFRSGNGVPVTRATIKLEEWEAVKAALAQREQEVAVAPSGAEPVYTNTEHGVTMQERNFSYEGNGWIQDNNFDYDAGWKVTGDFIGDDKDQYCQMICDALNNYTNPPQANNATEHPCDLLVAAAYRKAAEICEGNDMSWADDVWNRAVKDCAKQIRNAIPKESADALKEYVRGKCMEVAKAVWQEGEVFDKADIMDEDLVAIVNSVLEGKS